MLTDEQRREALREIMQQYIEHEKAWVEKYGSTNGFDTWFTGQLLQTDKTA